MNETKITLGTTGNWWKRPFLITTDEAKVHWHFIGTSGSGKSRALASLYLGLIEAGQPATLIDPHGDLARLVLSHLVAKGRFKSPGAFEKLIYLDIPGAARAGRYLPFNVINQTASPYATASNIMEAFHRAFPSLNQGAPMFDTLVQNGTKALISSGLPLTALYRFLTDKAYRDTILGREPDPDVVSVFKDWFDKLAPRDQMDQSGSTVRRINLLTFDPVLKHSLGFGENILDFRRLFDEGRSLIVNLAFGSGDAKRLYGCLLTVLAEQGALSRADLPPEAGRRSHHLILDEFSQFVSQSGDALGTMLSETRKFGLFAVLAHQTWHQVSELRGGLQNAGIRVIFRQDREDAVQSAPLIGEIDTHEIKHTVEDEHAQERTHPVFTSLPEQWEHWVQEIQHLKDGVAYIRFSKRKKTWKHTLTGSQPQKVIEVHTPHIHDSPATPDEMARVEREYLHRYFRAPVSMPRPEMPPQRGRVKIKDETDIF